MRNFLISIIALIVLLVVFNIVPRSTDKSADFDGYFMRDKASVSLGTIFGHNQCGSDTVSSGRLSDSSSGLSVPKYQDVGLFAKSGTIETNCVDKQVYLTTFGIIMNSVGAVVISLIVFLITKFISKQRRGRK